MIDYEKMSDSELSLAILKMQTRNLASNYAFYATKSCATCEVKSDSGDAVSVKSFDINNWSDMGPIIHDNKFDINWCRIQGGYYTVNDKSLKIIVEHESNELRAAAIVYLLMMGE